MSAYNAILIKSDMSSMGWCFESPHQEMVAETSSLRAAEHPAHRKPG